MTLDVGPFDQYASDSFVSGKALAAGFSMLDQPVASAVPLSD
jgi:hypothetical protein